MKTNFATMTQAERENLSAGQPVDYTSDIRGKASFYDYDETLKATVETTKNGERYIVELRDGELARKQRL
jgi:hypothetical protein